MIWPALTRAEAVAYLERLSQGQESDPASHEIGFGQRDDSSLPALASELEPILEEYVDSDPEMIGPVFDSRASVIIHKCLRIEDRIAADDDFWRFVACSTLYFVIQWRHRDKPIDTFVRAGDTHFGIGKKWECVPQRLWLRAELAFDPHADDPYHLCARGGVDFWTSGVIRVLHGCSRPIVRALVRYQFPEPGRFKGNVYMPQKLSFNGIRELYKRLRHFRAFVAMEALSDSDGDNLVASVAEGLK